jgi:hypothetical protein
MNIFIATAEVADIEPRERADGTIKYFMILDLHRSFKGNDGVEYLHTTSINASGVPKRHHMNRWSCIEVGDTVYIDAILNSNKDNSLFLTINDLGLAKK